MKNIPYYEMGEWKFRMVQNVMEKNNNKKKGMRKKFFKKWKWYFNRKGKITTVV